MNIYAHYLITLLSYIRLDNRLNTCMITNEELKVPFSHRKPSKPGRHWQTKLLPVECS